jgi:uncharacterized membrane protein
MENKKSFDEIKKEVIARGGFFVYFYFDITGTDKESIKNLAVSFSGKITTEKGVRLGITEIEEPIEKDGMFITALKASLLVENFYHLVRLTMVHMPIAIEIEEPLDITLDAGQVQLALLQISDLCQQFTTHILTKTLTQEEKKKFEKELIRKLELGKNLKEKIQKKQEGEK